MILNKKNSNTSRVKFISYTGEYPNLCSGVLTLEIDGKQYKFGHDYSKCHYHTDVQKWVQEDEDPNNLNFNSFWISGGSVSHDKDWNWDVREAEWKIDVDELPEQFWDIATEIDAIINENIPYGCCGGCI